MSAFKPAKTYTDAKGYLWTEHCVEFTSPDGRYGFYISAISEEHARLQVQAIRETATYEGPLFGTVARKS